MFSDDRTQESNPTPPKKFVPFSPKDSQSIEDTFQEIADSEPPPESRYNDPHEQSESGPKVPVNEDYLFDVDVNQRELSPAYWLGPVYDVRRGFWFFQDGSSLKPCEENLATQLEEGYLKLSPWRSDSAMTPPTSRTIRPSQPNVRSSQDSVSNSPGDTARNSDRQDGPRTHRLFGAYMNSFVTYQDSSTALLTTDDFMSRVSTTVFQKLGGVAGTKVVRGYLEARKQSGVPEAKVPPGREPAPNSPIDTKSGVIPDNQQLDTSVADVTRDDQPPKLERRMSSLASGPQNITEFEEQARKQEQEEMEDSKQAGNEDRERQIDHVVLVTHGIGQRLGLRLESVNFIHDVNVLRKTLKRVYKASPDLQSMNSSFADSDKNCRVQVLPV